MHAYINQLTNRSETSTSILFLCKIIIKIVAQCLPSSHHVTYKASTFFLCLGKLSHSFLSLDQFPTFYPMCFQCHETSLRIFNGKFFARVTYSGTSLSFTSKPFFSFMSINSPFLSSPGCISSLCNGNTANRISYFSHSLHSILMSLSASSLFGSLLHIHVCCPIPCFNYPYLCNVMWVYHWETKRKHG